MKNCLFHRQIIIVYEDNPMEPTQKLLEIINEFSKVTDIMSTPENFENFRYTSSKQLETEKNLNNIYDSLKRIDILRHKSNKICARSECSKLQKSNESKKTK